MGSIRGRNSTSTGTGWASAAVAHRSSESFVLRAKSSNHRGGLALRRVRAAGRGGLGKQNYLRDRSVGGATLRNYQAAVLRFEKEMGMDGVAGSNLATVDRAMCEYFNLKFFEGYGHGLGRHTLFGWLFLRVPDSEHKVALSEARRSLAGWTKAAPGGVGLPLPPAAVHLLAQHLVEIGLPRMAACVLLQMDLYARPSEIVELLVSEVVPPNPFAGGALAEEWAVQFFSTEVDRGVSKTGQSDETVLVGICGRGWLREVLATLIVTAESERLFPFDLREYERAFGAGMRALNLTSLQGSPHALRHTGPSHDVMEKRITLEQAQKRGRWASFKSVVRYEKHGRMLRQAHKLVPEQHAAASRALAALRSRLVLAIRAEGAVVNDRAAHKRERKALPAAACRRRRVTK